MIKKNIDGKHKVGLLIMAMLILSIVVLYVNASLDIKADMTKEILNSNKNNNKSKTINVLDDKLIFNEGINESNYIEQSNLSFNYQNKEIDLDKIKEYKIRINLTINTTKEPTKNDENHFYFGSGNYSSVAFNKNYLEIICDKNNILTLDRHMGLSHIKTSRKEENNILIQYSINNENNSLNLYMRVNNEEYNQTLTNKKHLKSFNKNNFWLSVTKTTSTRITLNNLDLLY